MDPEYEAYRTAQIVKSEQRQGLIIRQRVTTLIGCLMRADRRPPYERSVLCIGARNRHECDVFHAVGFDRVVGIDLAWAPGLVQMDMHDLQFPDQTFDVVFACHSLEHAWDVDQALAEWARVTRSGGTWAIEVPVRFTVSDTDRHDFGSAQGLIDRCAPYLDAVWFQAEGPAPSSAQLIARRR